MSLTERDIEIGFWRFGFADTAGFVPASTTGIPADIDQRQRLSLNLYGEEEWTATQRKKFQQEWLALLPALGKLKYLWLGTKINQEIFEQVCKMPALEGLWMKSTSITSVHSIRQLQTLQHLFLGNSPAIENVSPLCFLSRLITLHTEGLKKITDFSFLGQLQQLQGLIIEGGLSAAQTIVTLKPFSQLINLKYLAFVNVKVLDKDILPLTSLVQLERLDLHTRWTKADFQKVYQALPRLKFGDVKEFGQDL